MNTHGLIVQFGKHKGELWTRVPKNYLKWLANEGGDNSNIAIAELERRGTAIEHTIDLSGHSIDRASLRCLKTWRDDRNGDEGLYTWLERVSAEAIEATPGQPKVAHKGMKFVFKLGQHYPVLLSVMPVHQDHD